MVGVEAVQRLDQPDRRDLLEIVQWHAATPIEAPGDRVGEREMCPDQPFTGPGIAVLRVRAEVCRVTPAIGPAVRDAAVARRRAVGVAGSSRRDGCSAPRLRR
jgi:hypothetical protein